MLKSLFIKFFYLIGINLLFIFPSWAQHSISKYEFIWALGHPFAAIKIKHNLPKAMCVYKNVKLQKNLDTLEFGGKLDAFRHTYTMAFFARKIKVKKLRKLGIAHEKGNKKSFMKGKMEFNERADSLACEMDLRNNELGFEVGFNNKLLNNEELKELVIIKIKAGNAWYLKRDLSQQYLSCSGTRLNIENYRGIWYVPKCLIKTNE